MTPIDLFMKVDANENARISMNEWEDMLKMIGFEAEEETTTAPPSGAEAAAAAAAACAANDAVDPPAWVTLASHTLSTQSRPLVIGPCF